MAVLTSDFLHVSLGLLAGSLLIVLGFVTLSRDKDYRLNQLFSTFFLLIALFFILDSALVFLSTEEIVSDPFALNLLRDMYLVSLIIGLAVGGIAAVYIRYGMEMTYSRKLMLVGGVTLFAILVLGLLGDSVVVSGHGHESGEGHHGLEISRNLGGWAGVVGSLVLFLSIMGYYIGFTAITSDQETKSRLIRLLAGQLLMVGVSMIFDVSFAFNVIGQLVDNDLIHLTLHLVVVAGGILSLSSFWRTQAQPDSHSQEGLSTSDTSVLPPTSN